jgi:hypothetical protein
MNSRWHKAILWACFAVFAELTCCDRVLTLQLIFMGRLVTMIIWTLAGIIKEGFTFKKFFLGAVKLVWYYILLFLWVALDHAFETSFAFNFFYATIVLDMIHSFLKHAPILWIWISPKIYEFIRKSESRVNNFFLNKAWLTEDLDPKKDTNGWSTPMSSDVPTDASK